MRQIASVNFKKTFIFSCLFKEDFLRVHQGYITKINSTTGKISNGTAYSIADTCDGDPYGAETETLSKLVANYKIDSNDSTDFIGYIDSSTTSTNTLAYTKGPGCNAFGGTKELKQITQNDESITGVRNSYSLPISISK